MECEEFRTRGVNAVEEFQRLDRDVNDVISERNSNRVEASRAAKEVEILKEQLEKSSSLHEELATQIADLKNENDRL